MLQKLRNKLQSEKGFTLVELLAVIVILGIIVAIAVPAIGSIINKAESDASDREKDMIVEAARLAFASGAEFSEDGYVTVTELTDNDYLEEQTDADNPLPTGYVSLSDGQYTFNTGDVPAVQ
ncbi:competence type IV pilus major pilin ComGC [Aquibacillus koreensis]|uniref:competence type IV pilus major pilin ComGC n=1 Tax=Aquibacillus koreensis TaxID=279446 RepID=UPI0023422F86|nr:type II secretion system protein [Aquibacillus koreensis]